MYWQLLQKLLLIVGGIAAITCSPDPSSAKTADSPLFELAAKKFGNSSFTKCERKLLDAASAGGEADCKSGDKIKDDPANASSWGDDRQIRHELIEWLCRNPQANISIQKGIWISGAKIKDTIDIRQVSFDKFIYIQESYIPDGMVMYGAKIQGLSLNGTHTGPVYANPIRVSSSVFLGKGFLAKGAVQLNGSEIGNNLDCTNGRFENPEKVALNVENARINGNMFLSDGFSSNGEVVFRYTSIGGLLDCQNAKFNNNTGIALNADYISVKGDVFLKNNFYSYGVVRFAGANFGGNFECTGGKFYNDGGVALLAQGVNVGGFVLLDNTFSAFGLVSFVNCKIGGSLICNNGNLVNQNNIALLAENIVVRGDAIFSDGFTSSGEVRLSMAKIGGDLVCNGYFANRTKNTLNAYQANVSGDVLFGKKFVSDGCVFLNQAVVGGGLRCFGSEIRNLGRVALCANHINVKSDIILKSNFFIYGTILLNNAIVGGSLIVSNGFIMNQHRYSVSDENDGTGGTALWADGITVRQCAYIGNKLAVLGGMRFVGGNVGNDISIFSSRLINPGQDVLSLDSISVKGDLGIYDLSADGHINLNNAVIDQHFHFLKLSSSNDKISLNLSSSKVGILNDAEDSWPLKGKLFIQGLTYREISSKCKVQPSSRLKWLTLQPVYSPQPYEYLANFYRSNGFENESIEVEIEKNKALIASGRLQGLEWLKQATLGTILGYGYQSWRALIWGAGIIVLGWGLFYLGYKGGLVQQTKDSSGTNQDYPRFNAFMYSLDMFVPVINLYMRDYWLPSANRSKELCLFNFKFTITGALLRVYLWFHIFAGWTLTSFFVVGLTGLVKK